MTEPPEHRACRTRITAERRAIEEALNQWRLGDSNWRNIYIGGRHVGVIWEPDLPVRVIAAMNGDPERDERVRVDTARGIAEEILAAYDASGDRALLEAVAIAHGHAAGRAGVAVAGLADPTGPTGPPEPSEAA